MRLAAISFAGELANRPAADLILCSTFVDVAALRALGPKWVNEVPIYTYFHENQFAYPVQVESERDFHFALTNYTSALASDSLAFNSRYNLESFLLGVRGLLKKADDMELPDGEELIRAKSSVIPPGLDFSMFSPVDSTEEGGTSRESVIVWNHRWEHDKNPDLFFKTLFLLDREKIPFKLAVLGQSFQRRPAIFAEAQKKLAHRILHFGFCQSREEYAGWLQKGDLVVSTAEHEFFGLAVLEAVRAGCRPVLPNRLAYPELFSKEYLFDGNTLYPALISALKKGRLDHEESRRLTAGFAWEKVAGRFAAWLGTAMKLR